MFYPSPIPRNSLDQLTGQKIIVLDTVAWPAPGNTLAGMWEFSAWYKGVDHSGRTMIEDEEGALVFCLGEVSENNYGTTWFMWFKIE